MIEREELIIKKFRTGVTFCIFSDIIYDNLPENPNEYQGPFPSYVLFNNLNIASSINTFDGDTIWSRNGDNNFVPLSTITSNYYITGHSIITQIDSDLSQEQINVQLTNTANRLADPIRFPNGTAATNFVFYKKNLIDDFYVDVKLERNYESLDTLKIYNNLINSSPDQESKTGVVFGRLMAIQKLKNENGQSIRVPLSNVPIGVFNSSETFPQLFSTDENGDRISLNLKESTTPNEYFDTISYNEDYNSYLKSGEAFSAVPAQYKYITKTNDDGEFIIYDVPVGQQTVVLEVDLFKQGLTKDEISLNFFPFPTTDQPNIDTIPSFVYKQFPIDVVPAWGLSQTGYTSLDININLDLRKWSTYIIPPVSFDAEKLEQTVSRNITRTLKVEVMDMTSPNFTKRLVEIIQIPDDLGRESGAQYLWFDEFAQKRNKIEFNKFGCNVFKLPANIYDPNGFRTDKNGVPTTKKGVWLAAYQFKTYIDSSISTRTTGTHSYLNGRYYSRSHFDLNNTLGNDQSTPSSSTPPQIGVFPYEKPWSAVYPEPYSIPKKPTQQRFTDGTQRMLHPNSTPGNPVFYYSEPAYSDGDLVGNEVIGSDGVPISGGFGVQNLFNNWLFNRISNVVTKNYMYKYEKGVSWSEKYANGFQPYWNQSNNPFGATSYPFAGVSSVYGGEKYQRVECGYGYFLKPQGWGRVGRADWGADVNFDTSFLNNANVSNPGPSIVNSGIIGNWYSHETTYLTMYNLDNQNLTLAMNPGTKIPEGTLDIYRVVESGVDNIVAITNFAIPTFVRLRVEESKFAFRIFIVNRGDVTVSFINSFNPNGSGGGVVTFSSPPGIALPGQSITLKPGESCYTSAGDANETIKFTSTLLPGNSSLNSETNKYDSAIYEIGIYYYNRSDLSNNQQLVQGDITKYSMLYGNADVLGTQEWFVRTQTNGGSNGLVHEGVTKDFFYGGNSYDSDGGVSLYNIKLELGPSLYGTFNDGNADYGFGHYE